MSDRFHPISMEQLTGWVFDELHERGSILGVPRDLFFVPSETDRFRVHQYGRTLDSPFGVAAGPHTQMAQNIIVAWLCGARLIELKTVQTLDELDVNKPCIDLEDEGYNVEWSQELKVFQSFDEYLRAWVLIHALHDKLGFPGDRPGVLFNMSVGYNLEGILQPNVQWYLDTMSDASRYLDRYVRVVAAHHPPVADLDIPTRFSDTVTLSTMHGCPPDEIEAISTYLLRERGLHTSVKANPTLLGADRVRAILADDLGYADVSVPDQAFGHDLAWVDAVPMFHNLRRIARAHGLEFGVKLTNTLEVENSRSVFTYDEMMYMSGRALHAVTTNLAMQVSEAFDGDLLISFAGGADCFNVPDLLRAGMSGVTVCSDLLKSGGYLRLLQYFETTNAAFDRAGARDIPDLIARSAIAGDGFGEFASMLRYSALTGSGLALDLASCRQLAGVLTAGESGPAVPLIERWAADQGMTPERTATLGDRALKVMARLNLRDYADRVRSEWRLRKEAFLTSRSKTARTLALFDCIEAPCVDECPIDQNVPRYMRAVRRGEFEQAVAITRWDNPIPSILGHVCDHLCEHTCIRTHYDEPLAIREIKRFIMAQERDVVSFERGEPTTTSIAVIGAGPAGISAARQLAYAGFSVTIFELHPYAGGMVGGAIPTYRLPQAQIDQDLTQLAQLGVEVRYGQKAGRDFTLSGLRDDGFRYVVVSVGAQIAKRLGLEGEDAEGILDGVGFLRSVREGSPVRIGRRVAVIGAGDTAMDCARSAWRLGASQVTVVYRRTIDQMPADREEVRALLAEGVRVEELAKPVAVRTEEGRLTGLECKRMEYRGDRDATGRKVPHEVAGSGFDLAFDTMILAISQHSILDFFDGEVPELTERGYLRADPETLETSLPDVYAAGDVAGDGPASIVKAAADGKRVAAAIIAREASGRDGGESPKPDVDLVDMLRRRSHRSYRVPITHIPVEDRRNFSETTLTYTPEEAIAEAQRCLDCDTMCSICVGVCPNLAIMTYEMRPFRTELPALTVTDQGMVTGPGSPFRVDQGLQIAVLTDFCNECGNCATFCPTAGRPYRDKPRLYLDRADFEAQSDNAFMVSRAGEEWRMDARWGGETHTIVVNGDITYSSPAFSARLEPKTLAVKDLTRGSAAVGEGVSLERSASMYVLLRGLCDSMSHVPTAGASSGTRVSHPGYRD